MVSKNDQIQSIETAIHWIRGQRVMLDSDLAGIYRVTTKQLNQAVRRNADRFPEDFSFVLDREEDTHLRSQFVTSSSNQTHGGRRHLPRVFTEHGAIMLASILNSRIAIEASVRVVRAFVRLREMLMANKELALKFSELERRMDSHDKAIANLFQAIRQLIDPQTTQEKRELGFHIHETAPRYSFRKRRNR